MVAAGDADDVIDAQAPLGGAMRILHARDRHGARRLQRQGGVLDEQALKRALAPHLCRCGSHIRILRAAREALRISAGTR